jgi:hypothetical protein
LSSVLALVLVFGPLRTETAAPSQLEGSRRCTAARRIGSQVARPNAVQALFFGDFLLGQQKKVTRPPGRDPAPFK